MRTRYDAEKITRLARATGPGGLPVHGYEVRHGRVAAGPGYRPWLRADGDDAGIAGVQDTTGTVVGTTLHGLFEDDALRSRFQIDRIADACREYLDTELLWRLVQEASLSPPARLA